MIIQRANWCLNDQVFWLKNLQQRRFGFLIKKWHWWFTFCDHLNRKLGKWKEMPIKKKERKTLNYQTKYYYLVRKQCLMLNIICQLDWVKERQAVDQTLFWVCLWGCFWMILTFESVDLVKQIVIPNVGGPHVVNWRPK